MCNISCIRKVTVFFTVIWSRSIWIWLMQSNFDNIFSQWKSTAGGLLVQCDTHIRVSPHTLWRTLILQVCIFVFTKLMTIGKDWNAIWELPPLPFFGCPIRCPLHLWCLYILLLLPLGSTQPAMSSHSPPLDPPFSLFVSAWLILFFLSLSLGRHLARLRRSIPATALQENPVSCYSGSLPLWPLPHHPSKSYHIHKMDRPTYTKILYVQTHIRKGNKMGAKSI